MLLHLSFGTLYCWGNFNSYAPGHLKNFDGSFDPALNKKPDIIQCLPFSMLAQAFVMPFAGPIIEALGPGRVALLAGCLVSSGIILASFAPSLGVFAMFYGGLYGSGIGIGYTAPLVAGWKHFPNAKGKVTGCVVGAFGFGGFVFNNVGSAIFNPSRLSVDKATKLYPEEVTENFSHGLCKLAAIYLALACIASPMIRFPRTDSRTVAATAAHAPTKISTAVRTSTFWIMWLSIALVAQGPLYVASNYKGIALQSPALQSDRYLALVGALGGVTNGLSRPIWGSLYDRFGFRQTLYIVASLEAMILFAFPKTTDEPALFAAAVMGAYAVLGGGFAIAAPEVHNIFGNASVFGCMFSAFAFASLGGHQIADTMGDVFASSGANTNKVIFTWLSIVATLALFAVSCHKKPGVPDVPEHTADKLLTGSGWHLPWAKTPINPGQTDDPSLGA
jgi:OFA family oxalate/formate antiporter-like MFS transporter